VKLGKINKNLRVFYVANSFYYGSYDIINAFLAVLITVQVTDGRLDAVGLVIGYYMFIRAIMEVPLTKLTNKWPNKRKVNFIVISGVLYGFLIALMGFSSSLVMIFVIQTFIAIIDSLTYPIKWSIFSNILDKGNEETEWGIEDSLSVMTTAAFSVIGGVLSQKFGIEFLFITMGIMFAMSGLLFHFMKLRHDKFIKE
jgi:MFS family permease